VNEVINHTMTIADSFTVYAAGYDVHGNYSSDIAVSWSTTGDLDDIPTGPSISATYSPTTAGTSGAILADDDEGHTDETGIITVAAPPNYLVFVPLVMK